MILVTGASGLIGAALVDALAAHGACVRAGLRQPRPGTANSVVIGDIGPDTDWTRALEGVTTIVHLAGPAHARRADAVLHRATAAGSANLAAHAARAGVSRLVFVSSIKAAAARTHGVSCSERDAPAPEDGYGRAKLAAEQAVLTQPTLQPVILRPPLVFASNARGNFARLLRLADTPLPLPLGAMKNKRSLIALDSLIEAIALTVQKPAGPSGVFHVADATALSTSAMLTALREGMGRPARLFRLPGLRACAPRALTESLEVDASKFRAAYGWTGRDARAALIACGAAWRGAR